MRKESGGVSGGRKSKEAAALERIVKVFEHSITGNRETINKEIADKINQNKKLTP